MITMPAPFRPAVERGTGADRFCRCDDPAGLAHDLGRRISSHRTSQGHLVYFRCDCGLPHMAVLTWTRDEPCGPARLR